MEIPVKPQNSSEAWHQGCNSCNADCCRNMKYVELSLDEIKRIEEYCSLHNLPVPNFDCSYDSPGEVFMWTANGTSGREGFHLAKTSKNYMAGVLIGACPALTPDNLCGFEEDGEEVWEEGKPRACVLLKPGSKPCGNFRLQAGNEPLKETRVANVTLFENFPEP